MTITSNGLPSIGTNAAATPSPIKIAAKGSFIRIKIGRINVIHPKITPAARYANCLIVISPISLN